MVSKIQVSIDWAGKDAALLEKHHIYQYHDKQQVVLLGTSGKGFLKENIRVFNFCFWINVDVPLLNLDLIKCQNLLTFLFDRNLLSEECSMEKVQKVMVTS